VKLVVDPDAILEARNAALFLKTADRVWEKRFWKVWKRQPKKSSDIR